MGAFLIIGMTMTVIVLFCMVYPKVVLFILDIIGSIILYVVFTVLVGIALVIYFLIMVITKILSLWNVK